MRYITIFLLLCTVFLYGCLGSKQSAIQTPETATATTQANESQAIASLELSTTKESYSAKEAIPLELTVQNGKFDLLVPISTVTSLRAFKQLTVTDSNGEVIKAKKIMPLGNTLKTLYKEGKSIRCIKGLDMKSETSQKASLANLQTYYQLGAGKYIVKLTLELEVYKEFMQDQHPEIIELEREILKYQNSTNPQFTPEVKKTAIEYTQGQIDIIKEKYKDELQDIYLPLKSRRGMATLESNIISLTVE